MNPLLKDRRALGLYLGVWLVLGLFLAAILATTGRAPWANALAFALPMMGLYGFISLSAWTLCRTFPLRETRIATILAVFLLSAGLSSGLWYAMGMGWSSLLEQISGLALALDWRGESGLLLFVAGALLFMIATIVHYLIATFAAARGAERSALELQVLARDAELRALRAQIDPHFLFNSLNSISALTASDPGAAREMTLRLAEFLRLSLEYGSQDSITLDQELSLAMRFLEIEQVRFGKRLGITTSIEDRARSCHILPLLLQPLVENAVRHGIAELIGGGTVEISARMEGNHVRIVVANPIDLEIRRASRNGIGLENVRQRIAKMYGQEGRLDARLHDDHFDAAMILPAR